MFDNIETKEDKETIVTRRLALTLTEAEVNAILVDPRKFQKTLRAVRNTWYGTESKWSATGHGPGRPRQKPAKKTVEKNNERSGGGRPPGSRARSAASCSTRAGRTSTWNGMRI